MVTQLSETETSQLLRTVEMFEAITESQPDDYQSLEILKEAYTKLGRQHDSLLVSKKLARAYANLGQISQAILEYEGILQEYPADESVAQALAELEAKTAKLGVSTSPVASPLTEDSKPRPSAGSSAGTPRFADHAERSEMCDRALADVLLAERVVTKQAIQPLLQRLKTERAAQVVKGQSPSLLQLLADEQLGKLEDLLSVVVGKSGLPYLPLSVYDVEREIALLLPAELCFSHGIVPFDLISRSALIATANPFNAPVREQVRSMLDYNVFWYVSSPAEITAALRRAHGYENRPLIPALPGKS
jgi:tetratricopeptide (TPR) repeat protein